ncbi:MAG: thermonuclease family protein [Planctomycetota bacterium]
MAIKPVLTHIGAFLFGASVALVATLLVILRQYEAPGVRFSIEEDRLYSVERVLDGDTFVIDNGLHIRLIGIDAPEIGRYVPEPTPYGTEARLRLKQLIEGRKVKLQFGDRRVEPHGRIIANVFVPPEEMKPDDPSPYDNRGLWVSEILVREGLAEPATFFGADGGGFSGTLKLEAARAAAETDNAGLWSLSATSPMVCLSPDGRPFRYVAAAASKNSVFHPAGGGIDQRLNIKKKIGWPDLLSALASGRRPNLSIQLKIGDALQRLDDEVQSSAKNEPETDNETE